MRSERSDDVTLAELHARTLGDPAVIVAVLDGVPDALHPALSGARLEIVSVDGGGGEAPSWHGTHVTSRLAAPHGGVVAGLAPGCTTLAIPIFPTVAGGGLGPSSQVRLARAIHAALGRGAHVINVSGGQLDDVGRAEPLLAEAIAECARRGVVVVAAVGNDGCECLHIPASDPYVIAVGASDASGVGLGSNNWHPSLEPHGVLAPGADILGAGLQGYERRSGSSFATPYVTGVAALLLSYLRERGAAPDGAGAAVRAAILTTARPCTGGAGACRHGLGHVHPAAALASLEHEHRSSNAIRTTRRESMEDPSSTPPAAPPPSAEPPPAAPARVAPGQVAPGGLMASGACAACSGAPLQLVYVLGQIGYDFGTSTRQQWFQQQMSSATNWLIGTHFGSAADPVEFASFLAQRRDHQGFGLASAFCFTVVINGVNVYAIDLDGIDGLMTFMALKTMLYEQVIGPEGLTLPDQQVVCSFPGVINGERTLQNGQVVPRLRPALRGIYNWNIGRLIQEVLDANGPTLPVEERERLEALLQQLFQKLYFQLQNMGATSHDRALNMAGTNVYDLVHQWRTQPDLLQRAMIQDVRAEPAKIAPPGHDYWDVIVTMFNPLNAMNEAKTVIRVTIDVSDVLPIVVGNTVIWQSY